MTITQHGRETMVLMDAELSRRALEALEDAEDAREAAEVLSRIESGQERTYTMAEVALGTGGSMNDRPLINDAARSSNDIREVTRRLNAALGATLVSTLAGSTDTKASRELAKAGGPEPSPDEMRRLAFAYEQWQRVVEAEDADIARVWFVGMNPWLNDDSPINAIREDRLKEVGYAVQALIDDTWSG